MKVYFNSFSTPDFKPYLKDLERSAKKFGIKRSLIYGVKDLYHTDFYKKHKETFSHKTGFGYWLWKPFFVNEALKKLQEGDILFYVDAASLFIADPQSLIDIASTNESGIVAFDGRPLTNGQWTKRDAFVNTNCDTEEFHNAHKVIATVFLIRKTRFSTDFIAEWLRECENFNSLSDVPNESGKENTSDFIAHRMDQSILAVLVKKYNLETYRNPSKWGNFLKPEKFREPGEFLSLSYQTQPPINSYADEPQANSEYGTIFEFNRKANFPKVEKRVVIRNKAVSLLKKMVRGIKRFDLNSKP